MKAVSSKEIRQELDNRKPKEILELLLRLARFKKENKELLTYLLFESGDEMAFVQSVKSEIELQLAEINRSTKYLTKKGLRKIVRMINKYIRYSNIPVSEVEIRMHFCF